MSEFGSGIVIPLVKFTRHLNDDRADDLRLAMRWAEVTPSERLSIIEAGAGPFQKTIEMAESMEISDLINMLGTLWAYGASDHLLDLDLKMAPESLKKLRAILLELRYGDGDRRFNETQWREILSLWKESAMDIDESIGINYDWGDVL